MAILTNAAMTAEVSGLIGNDLDDLQTFLMTGQSAKYDAEPILGIWTSDRAGTMAKLRQRQPEPDAPEAIERKRAGFLSNSRRAFVDGHSRWPNDFEKIDREQSR